MMNDNSVDTVLLKEINSVLKGFPEYWANGSLERNKVIEDIRSYKENLISALLSKEIIKNTYSMQVNDITVFKLEDFIQMLRYKNYWENSYTKYRNEIGLTSEGKYLNYNSDVVLDFPYKDCLLEGGMSKEEVGKEEVYLHKILAKEEIDTLLAPKVLTNIKKFSQGGTEDTVDELKDTDNLIIKGNNLIALHTLKERYAGKIKLIYIDPPYNTGNDSFKYNDRFNRATWLSFMKNRLEIARELLSDDGSIYVQLDYNQVHYGKILMDEIFGEENFQREIIWRIGWISGYKTAVNNYIRNHDTILYYSKNHKNLFFNKKYIPNKKFKNLIKKEDLKRLVNEVGIAENKIDDIYQFINHENRPERYALEDVWNANEYDDLNSIAIMSFSGESVSRMLETEDLKGQKSEKLLKRIIESSTREGDIVLDFFMGSATSQAVAHKMKRQYIGIEQMDYIETISVARLQKVIEGEQAGISKDVEWQGGGSFVYAELYSLNEKYVTKIQAAKTERKLSEILKELMENAHLNFKVDFERLSPNKDDYLSLSLKQKKEILIEALDLNQLYLAYSEIEDDQYDISGDVKKFNHSFFKGDIDE